MPHHPTESNCQTTRCAAAAVFYFSAAAVSRQDTAVLAPSNPQGVASSGLPCQKTPTGPRRARCGRKLPGVPVLRCGGGPWLCGGGGRCALSSVLCSPGGALCLLLLVFCRVGLPVFRPSLVSFRLGSAPGSRSFPVVSVCRFRLLARCLPCALPVVFSRVVVSALSLPCVLGLAVVVRCSSRAGFRVGRRSGWARVCLLSGLGLPVLLRLRFPLLCGGFGFLLRRFVPLVWWVGRWSGPPALFLHRHSITNACTSHRTTEM